MLLGLLHYTYRYGQHNDFVERLQHHLRHYERQHLACRHHTRQRKREEYQRVGTFAEHCAHHGAQREMLAVGRYLHAAHHVGVDERAGKEGHKRGGGNARGKAEHGMEALVVVPVRRARNGVGQRSEQHEDEVHGEACPYKEPCLAESPHLTHAVVDNVRHRKHEQSAGDVHRSD